LDENKPGFGWACCFIRGGLVFDIVKNFWSIDDRLQYMPEQFAFNDYLLQSEVSLSHTDA
jgi:hypothetical protein